MLFRGHASQDPGPDAPDGRAPKFVVQTGHIFEKQFKKIVKKLDKIAKLN